MQILIAGGSGFIGQHLVKHWSSEHTIAIIGRDKSKLQQLFSKQVTSYCWDELERINAQELDIVINLCGYNIGEKRWSDAVKKQIIDSRVKTTETLINWLAKSNAKPHFYCANAIGLYGLQDDPATPPKTEDSPIESDNPPDFLTKVAVLWKQAAEKAHKHDIPLTITCFGVVLAKGEGMLKKLVTPFYLGLGSIIGSGKQNISWIHIDDVVKSYDYLVQHPEITNIINLCSPNPVSQKVFAKSLAKAVNRPLFLKTPEFLIKAMLGEMGECLILKGQSVIPKRLLSLDFEFSHPTIDLALQTEYQNS